MTSRVTSHDPWCHLTLRKVIEHPLYNNETLLNDVLLVKLSSPAVYTARVSPVCLAASRNGFSAGYKCVTTGWGQTNATTEQLPKKLQQVSLPLISYRKCQKIWGVNILNSMICAGAAGASSCVGDSGGPLVCQKNGTWTLVGIGSWANLLCNTSTPGAYTNLRNIQAWIRNVIARN
ncbi:hypothetical protein FKM82_029270 [Ascaphus truei]